jgi:type IV secretory pathway VirB2 component (pilin)
VNNLGKFGWQAIILAVSGVLGSLLAARLVLQLFFKKGGKQ